RILRRNGGRTQGDQKQGFQRRAHRSSGDDPAPVSPIRQISRHTTWYIRRHTEVPMKFTRLASLFAVAAFAILSASSSAQEPGYPIELIAPGKGTYTFPPGYETPWDKIQIMVTAKMAPNLFVIHGSEALDPAHPDASGGRVMALFGPDGVLMVD